MTRLGTQIACAVIGACLLSAGAARAQNASVCIDAGHGGHDPGAVGNGLQEKNLNLTASRAFRDWLELDTRDDRGGGRWTVFLTRDTDVFVSLTGRADYANSRGADYFMCIHTNAGGGDGTETFAYRSGTTADRLAHRVQEELLEHLGTRDRGVKYASFSVLVNTAMPADLAEMAFIDTWPRNAELLSDAANLDRVGLAHLHALQRMVGLPAYTPSDAPPPPEPRGSVAFATFPAEVDAGAAVEVVVTFETNLAELGLGGELVLQAKDGESWELIDEVVWDGAGGAGAGEHAFTVTAPEMAGSIFFVAFVTPPGAGWDGRLGDASTLETPTAVTYAEEFPEPGELPLSPGAQTMDGQRIPFPRPADGSDGAMYGGCGVTGAAPGRGGALVRRLAGVLGL